MHREIDMAHVLGMFAKWTAIIVVFGFSITLSYMFFLSITPHDKPWFTYTGLGLTEGGFLLWLAVFMLTKHQPVHKAIALVMSCACAFTSVVIAGYEFYMLLSSAFTLAHNALIIQAISILLEVMFAAHITAFIIDLFASYFARPGHTFRGPTPANLIRTNNVTVEQLEAMQNAITGHLAAIKAGGDADPLEQRQTVSLAQIAEPVNEAVSSLTKKAKSSIGTIKKRVKVPGKGKMNTSRNSSTNA